MLNKENEPLSASLYATSIFEHGCLKGKFILLSCVIVVTDRHAQRTLRTTPCQPLGIHQHPFALD